MCTENANFLNIITVVVSTLYSLLLDHPFYRGSGDFDQSTFFTVDKKYPFEVHYAEEMIRECPKSIVLQCKRWNLDEYELEKESLLLTLRDFGVNVGNPLEDN
ncbi:unnamed protein product [Rhizophagus irregularis]|uniref:Uncharacterized protein n=1 Tax=Rhizophagus irregularis TaxID=588596 RepID=A0A916DZV6_9GLOM|nr:unnamed protein product [Rhizophagus irregularis]CAB5180068.1 unnamed protein product [Rhizophagus irregularis]CAB5324612.1 unnamed protein product [Rhizophagus irregularis]